MDDYADIDTFRTPAVTVTLDQGLLIAHPTSGGASSPATVMDPGGDVILVVPKLLGPGNISFQVNSGMLCLASSVFREMLRLNSHFKEANALHAFSSGSQFEIALKDVNPKALAVLLRIIHMKYDLVPQSLDEDQLYEVAVVCDKYDMRQSLGYWVDKWLHLIVPDESNPPTETVKGHKWLFISYALAREKLFKALTLPLILTSPIDSSGRLQMRAKDGSSCNDYIPDPLYKNIADRRHAVLWAMLLEVKKLIGEYQYDKPTKCQLNAQEACDSYILGSLIRGFQRTNTYPLSETLPVMSKSIQELKEILCNIGLPNTEHFVHVPYSCRRCTFGRKLQGYCTNCGVHPVAGGNHAESCSPLKTFKKAIEAIYDRVEGLNPADFICWRNEGPEKGLAKPPTGQNLWDFIE